MAVITRRISGRYGQIWMQNGTTAMTDTAGASGTADTVDGIVYDAYQVWTLANGDGTKIPMDPSTIPTVTVGGTGAPAAYTFVLSPLRGQVIFTPALVATCTVSVSAAATPKMYAQGHSTSFGLDVKFDSQDATAQMEAWKHPLMGFREWSGSAKIFYASADWWNISAGSGLSDLPKVFRFYPAKSGSTEYWLGAGFVNWGVTVDRGSVVEQAVSFIGDGPLIYKAS